MKHVIELEGKWFGDDGEELKHIPKTRKVEHLLNSAGEVVAKRCGGLCGEMLPLDNFRICNRGFAKRQSYCGKCKSVSSKAHEQGLNIYGGEKRPIKPRSKRVFDEKGKCIRKKCPMCEVWKDRCEYRIDLCNQADGLSTQCISCKNLIARRGRERNPEKYKTYGHNRRAKEKALPGELSDEQWKATLDFFGDACALTGESDGLHLEHAIPIAIGQGGTVDWNCYPLVSSLNASKSASNLFEWAGGRDDVDKPKFNRLITFLADKCGLTVDEYRAFYYWCFANPRLTVEEIEADGDVDSLTLWKRSRT
ncbi:hypothetical protein [Heyndrickxia oleronia]|uniref:hypothetical protein n=1 Tax=Heyndrickxia oleronia TaxID=38875 RepID=UPI001C0F2923|nr:hypothetical protein [Heyndrickxia oleronia]MBU5211057.1 hypothetical protein [Heyndrickxia oleronia]